MFRNIQKLPTLGLRTRHINRRLRRLNADLKALPKGWSTGGAGYEKGKDLLATASNYSRLLEEHRTMLAEFRGAAPLAI